MNELNGNQVEKYIREEIKMEPRHNCDDLALAINDASHEFECDSFELMELVLTNKPINSLHTHSYGFHTANGRAIIDKVIGNYNEYQLIIKYNG
jgi:hypothetical protein